MKYNISPSENLNNLMDSLNDGDKIELNKGVYRLTAPLKLNGKKNISLKGTDAVITGSVILEGKWTEYDTSIFCMQTDKNLDIQQLYIDGERYIMARYPNEVRDEILNGFSEDTLSKQKTSLWKDPSTGYVRALHSFEWGGNDYRIEGKDSDGSLILKWVGDNNRGCDYHRKYLMAENIFEELDSPGEWFYDSKKGLLYVYPKYGKDLDRSVVEASVCGEIISAKDVMGLDITGIKFQRTKRMLFCSEYEKITRSDWAVARNGAVYISNCKNITLNDCVFDEIGGNCIFIDGKNSDIEISHCDFTNCGASGVCIFGNQKCVRDLSTWEDHHTEISDFEPGPKYDDYPRNVKILNCYFYNLGIYEKQTSAVSMSVCSRVTVKGCTVHRMPRAGINICDGSFGGHRILDNLVFDTVRETGDHGPFNSWGRDRFWSLKGFDTEGKNGEAKRPYATLDAIETTVLSHNMFCGNRGFGIDLDDGSSNYLITKNYCVGVGIKLREGFLRTVRNNYLLNARLDIHCAFAHNDDVIENNIIVSDQMIGTYANNDGFTTRAANNLFAGAPDKILEDPIVSGYRNYTCSKNDSGAASMNPKEIFFEKIDLDFGRNDRPKPAITGMKETKQQYIEYRKAVLSGIDDSIRSMAGLPDYCGAFVCSITEDSPLYVIGVRKDDVILKINGKDISSPIDLTDNEEIESIFINRSQRNMSFEKLRH